MSRVLNLKFCRIQGILNSLSIPLSLVLLIFRADLKCVVVNTSSDFCKVIIYSQRQDALKDSLLANFHRDPHTQL